MPSPINVHRRSPLFHRRPLEASDGAFRIAERPFLCKFILRGEAASIGAPLHETIGVSLPTEALTSASAGETSTLWLGPDEWMFVAAPGADFAPDLRRSLGSLHHQLVDVGDYYTVIEISGPKAREALMKITTLDVHARVFRPGMVAGSMFGRANAWLWQIAGDEAEGGPVFRLIIRWSMADYLWCLLANAGREWGMPREVPVKGERLTID